MFEGHALVWIEERRGRRRAAAVAEEEIDLDAIRPDLAEVLERQALTLDAARPDAVGAGGARRSQRTARENVDDLCDPGTFVEYGPLVVAAQRRRRTLEDLIEQTPADGMIAGIGRVNGDLFDDDRARCVVMSYDYTVLAGTQGTQNHRKKDRMFELAERGGCRSCSSPRAAAAGPATPTARRRRASTAWRSPTAASCRAWCRWSASTRAAASPATPRCSAAATWSSPPRTRTSAWAGRR